MLAIQNMLNLHKNGLVVFFAIRKCHNMCNDNWGLQAVVGQEIDDMACG